MRLTVAELFAGVGGFRVGLNHINSFVQNTGLSNENGDWEFVWANQWEPSTKIQHAYNCYITRFGKDDKHSNLDINQVEKIKIPNHNLLVGGFPCQDYSVARTLSKEKGIEGKKGVLWWDIRNVLEAKRPSFVLLENVDRLLKSPSSRRGRDFAIMLRTLNEQGYVVQWRVINAGEYGMPQRRRRVFIFACKNSTKYGKIIKTKNNLSDFLVNESLFNLVFPIEINQKKVEHKDISKFEDTVDISNNYLDGKFLTSGIMVNNQVFNFDAIPIIEQYYPLRDVIEKVTEVQGVDLESYIIKDENIPKWEYLKGSKRIERKRPDGTTYFYTEGAMCCPENLEMSGRTMLTSEGTVNRSSHIVKDAKTGKLRTITEIEAEVLQMFPVNWTNTGMPKRNRYFMMGNALVTGIVSRLEPSIKEIIENE